jgi:hypothetical protein
LIINLGEAEDKRFQLLEALRASFGIAWSKPWVYQKRFRQAKRDFGKGLGRLDPALPIVSGRRYDAEQVKRGSYGR